MKTSNSIKNWAEDQRPREKLQLKGKSSLSNAELLAILIGSGTAQKSAVEVSKEILKLSKNNLFELSKLNITDLCKVKGIGPAKAISIITALELGKRRSQEEVLLPKKIKSSQDAYLLISEEIKYLPHEEFWVIYLNNSNHILNYEKLSQGGINITTVDHRILFKKALNIGAVAIIIAHNHPSGSEEPSTSDKELTKKISEAGKLLDITLLDHLIVFNDSYFSFAENDLIND